MEKTNSSIAKNEEGTLIFRMYISRNGKKFTARMVGHSVLG